MTEDVKVYVCPAPSDATRRRFPDNLYGNCSCCEDEITFRPDAPDNIRKICFRCAVIEIEKAKALKDNIISVPWNQREVAEVIKELIEKAKGR